jgi:hypothetical protein
MVFVHSSLVLRFRRMGKLFPVLLSRHIFLWWLYIIGKLEIRSTPNRPLLEVTRTGPFCCQVAWLFLPDSSNMHSLCMENFMSKDAPQQFLLYYMEEVCVSRGVIVHLHLRVDMGTLIVSNSLY